jgi:predicted Zn-dependent protease
MRVEPIPLWRRGMMAVVAIALAGVVLHGWIAIGLVSRGDDLLRGGKQDRALSFYTRAVWFDPAWDVPADRFAFAASLTGRRELLEQGVALTSAHLTRDPGSYNVRWDRALCLLHLNRRVEALADLEQLARMRRGDWRMNDMALRIALSLGRASEAREFARYSRPQ